MRSWSAPYIVVVGWVSTAHLNTGQTLTANLVTTSNPDDGYRVSGFVLWLSGAAWSLTFTGQRASVSSQSRGNPRRTVTRSVRRVKLAMSEGHAYRKEFRAALD